MQTIITKISKTLIPFIFSVSLIITVQAQSFVHPGILNNQAELDFVKAKIQANQQPWVQAFNQLKNSNYASLTYTANPYITVSCGSGNKPNIGCSQIVDDGMAAYSLALMWSYTGDIRYATKSISIINAWSTTFQNITTESNQRLVVSWAAPWYVNAAEILRYSNSGWTNTHLTNFNGFLAKMLPYIKDDTMPGNNWVQSAIEAHLAISIFTDNRTEFNIAVSRWKTRVKTYIYQTTDGATPLDYPTGNVNINSSKWNGTRVFVNGLCMETCRDLGHLKLGVNSMMYAAQSAYEQGVDLFTLEQKRLSDFFELHGSWMTGSVAVPSNINGGYVIAGASDVVGIKPPTGGGGAAFEIAYNHLHTRLNKNLPYTLQMINSHRPAGAGHWVFKWETLTHGNLPFNLTIPTNNAPTVSISSPQTTTSNCTPASIMLNANAADDHGVQKVEFYNGTTLLNTDASAPYSYNWNNVTTGTYSITAKAYDASGLNTTSNSIAITINALPVIIHHININGTWNTTADITACEETSVTLGPWPAVANGWSWSGPNGFTSTQRDPTLSNIQLNQAGTYIATYKDANGCTAMSNATIQVNALPISTITSPANSFCAGGSVVLTASAGTSYKWFNGTTQVGTAATYTATAAGSYTVEVTNSAGCKATSAAKVITVNALPTATITSPVNSFCAGGSVVLTASTGTSHKWFNGTTQVGTAATYTATAAGSYTVEVTNSAGCKATSAAKDIAVNPLPAIIHKVKVDAVWTTANNANVCSGSTVTLGPWPALPNGWSWSGPNGFNAIVRDPVFTNITSSQSGIYTATYTDPNGCSATSTFNLQVSTAPTATITSPVNSFCTGGSVVLTASAGTSYKWFNGTTQVGTAATYTATAAGSYTVEVTNNTGCKNTSAAKVITVTAAVIWYADTDNDGKGDPTLTISACTQPAGYVSIAGDNCPADANKIEPGICGCSAPENTCTNQPQTITFTPFNGNKIAGDPDFTLTASSTSGLAVTFISSNSNVAIIVGNTVKIVGVGTTTITANQSGNTIYAPAFATQTLVVSNPVQQGILQVFDGNIQVSDNTTAVSIGNAPINTPSASKTITLKNSGTGSITIMSVVGSNGFSATQIFPAGPTATNCTYIRYNNNIE
ncbi:Ig-like domain-containing protein [Cytophaga aurantiaca]|uniref:Ig-like domain-containing protein n=1 Tax=Cytophaga aurantiaca TaxID=29530 RepID=UPI000382A1CE|nr:Ig-like domain-containing protein [Cytophaga aurantiaca]